MLVAIGCLAVMALAGNALFNAFHEPESCALCGDGVKYHAPAILNLATGAVEEMQVYEPHPYLAGEIAEEQGAGYTGIHAASGITVFTNAGISSRATLAASNAGMKRSLYCRKCRELLAAAGARGYALLDLYDPGNIRAYPIIAGAEYEIRDYTVTVRADDRSGGMRVENEGHIQAD